MRTLAYIALSLPIILLVSSCDIRARSRVDEFLGIYHRECTYITKDVKPRALFSKSTITIERAKPHGIWIPAPGCGDGSADFFLQSAGNNAYKLIRNSSSFNQPVESLLTYTEEAGFTFQSDIQKISIKRDPNGDHTWSFVTNSSHLIINFRKK